MAGKKETKSKYKIYIPQVKKIPDWYKKFNFVLVNSMKDLEAIFEGLEDKSYYIAFDTETTGLNFEELELVGYSFCLDGKTAYYVPVYHFEYDGNLGEEAVKFIYEKMCSAKKVFMYNARYDMRVMEYYGYKDLSEDEKKGRFSFVKFDMSKVDYFDVAVAVWAGDTNWKMPSLKAASLRILGIEQIHFDEVIEDAGNFFYLNPASNPDTVFYAAADALCTYLLVPATMKYFNEGGIATKVDNKVLYPLMHYEAEKMYLDGTNIDSMLKEAQDEVDRLEKEVYDMIGYQINLNSPIQVAQAFQRLGIDTGERTETGNMATGMKVLENLSDDVKNKYPALKSFVKYKETFKLVSSYLSVFKKMYASKGFIRGAYQTNNAPTGRLSAGKDGKNTFFSPVNVQALPKPHVMMYDVFDMGDMNMFSKKDNILLGYKFVPAKYHTDENGKSVHTIPTDDNYIGWAEGMDPHLNVRSLITPKFYEDSKDDDYVYVAADYAAQEIRITTNISRESVWMNALTSGGDVHRSCYSLDTEILTPDGWKTYDKIGVDDFIAEYNDDIDRIEWVKAGHIYWNESDTMYHFWGKNTDLLVTPNHRMWTRGRDNWYIHRADRLAKRKRFDTICSPMLPEKTITYDSFIEIEPTYHREGYFIKLEDFVELLGYVVTDGGTCLRSGGQKEVYFGQSEVKSSVLKKMQALNTRLNNLFKETVEYISGKEISICGKKATNNGDFHRFSVFSSKLFDFIISIIGGPLKKDRKLNDWVFGLSDELQGIFIRAMIDGDGSYDGNGKDKTRSGCLYIPSDILCDQVQIMMMGLGYSTHISKVSYETGSTMNRIFFCKDRRVVCVNNEFTEIIKYDEPVKSFCFSVPSGLLVVRRDGKISVCGNTAEALWGKENYNKDLRKRAKGCFSTDSYLFTSKGAIKCLDTEFNTLLDLDGKEQNFGYTVEDRNGYKIELSNGMIIEVTKDHKFLALDSFDKRWITADKITEGTQLGLKPMEQFGGYQTVYLGIDKNNMPKFTSFDEGLAYLCGIYVGDTNSKVNMGKHSISFVVSSDNLGYVLNVLGRFGSPYVTGSSKEEDFHIISMSKRYFGVWVEDTFGVGKDRYINDLVYRSPKSVMRNFLAGMIDSDSNITKYSIEYHSSLESLCRDFGTLTSFLGYTVLSMNKNPYKYKDNKVDYVSKLAFEQEVLDIPIMVNKKIETLKGMKQSVIRSSYVVGYSILDKERKKFNKLGEEEDRKDFVSGRFDKLSRTVSEKIGDWRYEYIPVTVKSKREKEIKAFVMECETHYFVGNGLVSHNCNFGIIYGMGATSLVDEKYGIHTLEQAQEFFEQYKGALPELFQWIDRVQRRAKRVGTVYTYFGRPRRVKGYYDAGNAGFANRTAVNTQIQGTAGDILKIVMCRLWDNLLNNPKYRDDVRFMITIHDEIGYSVRASKAHEIMDLIEKNQTIILKEWPVPIITEASCGWSVGGLFAFEKVKDDNPLGFKYYPKLD